jgi:hypothetical protein
MTPPRASPLQREDGSHVRIGAPPDDEGEHEKEKEELMTEETAPHVRISVPAAPSSVRALRCSAPAAASFQPAVP